MKDPKDMTRYELADALDALEKYLSSIVRMESDQIREAAARLRNSIDRPTIEFKPPHKGIYDEPICFVVLNGKEFEVHEGMMHEILAALGMEGGA